MIDTLLFEIFFILYLVVEVYISILNLFFRRKILFVSIRGIFLFLRLMPIGEKWKNRTIDRSTAIHMKRLKSYSIYFLLVCPLFT